MAAAGTYISRQYRQHALKKLCNVALMKRFGTTDTNEITAFADAYTAAVEVRDAAQADLNTKSATADAYYNTLTTNEQAILLEVRRFAPAAFDIPTADQVLRRPHSAARHCPRPRPPPEKLRSVWIFWFSKASRTAVIWNCLLLFAVGKPS